MFRLDVQGFSSPEGEDVEWGSSSEEWGDRKENDSLCSSSPSIKGELSFDVSWVVSLSVVSLLVDTVPFSSSEGFEFVASVSIFFAVVDCWGFRCRTWPESLFLFLPIVLSCGLWRLMHLEWHFVDHKLRTVRT